MQGLFIFPTCRSIGMTCRATLRNTDREARKGGAEANGDLKVDLRVFADGQLVEERLDGVSIAPNGSRELSAKTLPVIESQAKDFVVLAKIRNANPAPGYFAQEHQFVCSGNERTFSSLVYDQLPMMPAGKVPSPIVVLAPKTWVGSYLKTYLIFVSGLWDEVAPKRQARPLDVRVLDGAGRTVAQAEHTGWVNGVWIFDVKAAVAGKIPLDERPTFLNVVARGGAATHVVVTIVQDERTGNTALEHSLAPPYYASEGFDRIRREALIFS